MGVVLGGQPNHLGVVGSHVQWRELNAVESVDIGAALEQQARGFGRPAAGGPVQRRRARFFGGVDILHVFG